jgi:glucoamylase
MGRPVILGNGSLTVGLNEVGLVNDFYYPYVGLDNLTNARFINHKVGIWVDNKFSWVDDLSWEIDIDLSYDSLLSMIKMTNKNLKISLYFEDFVDNELNVFGRQIKIFNNADNKREIRLFLHQVFQISRSGRADTGIYEPEEHYILDYKGRCSLLIYGQDDQGNVFDQFAIGNYGIEGKEGTYMDAEDGDLSNSPVEHGGVDSVIRLVREVEPMSEFNVDYWIVAADSQYSCEKIHNQVLVDTLPGRAEKTKVYWREWLSTGNETYARLSERDVIATKKSLMLIKVHADRRGGIIASCDSSIYNYGRDYYSYVWPRDGAYAVWPLIRLGFKEEAENFFNFCRDILTEEGYLMHKYQPDRAIGSTWHPLLHGNHKELAIQEDETAIVVFMIGEYAKYSNDHNYVRGLYDNFIKPACDFMSVFMDSQTDLPHATYDLWEEKFLTTTYTVSVVYQALMTGIKFAEDYGYTEDAIRWQNATNRIKKGTSVLFNNDRNILRKGFLLQEDETLIFDDTLDISSIYGSMIFDLPIEFSEIEKSMSAAENILLDQSASGGSPRYEKDNYFASNPQKMGNPWFVTTLWLAQYYIRIGNIDKAEHYIDWTLRHSYKSGLLSEQINPNTGETVGVSPLVWSHAEVINTILDIDQVKNAVV